MISSRLYMASPACACTGIHGSSGSEQTQIQFIIGEDGQGDPTRHKRTFDGAGRSCECLHHNFHSTSIMHKNVSVVRGYYTSSLRKTGCCYGGLCLHDHGNIGQMFPHMAGLLVHEPPGQAISSQPNSGSVNNDPPHRNCPSPNLLGLSCFQS